MNIFDGLILVLRIMKEKKLRVFLTISGILIGIFTFCFFQFASQGLSQGVENQISTFGLNVLNINSVDGGNENGPPTGDGLTEQTLEEIKRVTSGYKYIAPNIFVQQVFTSGREEQAIVTLAFRDEELNELYKDLNFQLLEGREIRPGDSNVVVIGYKVATQTFEKDLIIGSSLKVDDKSFRVIGILEPRDDLFIDSSMRMPFDDLQDLAEQDTFSNIRISYFQGVDIEAEEEKIESFFNKPNKPREISVSSPRQALESINQIFFTLNIIIGFISAIALVVGGINVMNTMYSNVLERINEISVFKAIGATNQDIVTMYVFESMTLSLLGAMIGYFTAFGVAKLLSGFVQESLGFFFPVTFSTSYLVVVVIATLIFGTFFGAYPAYLAAKVNPADNLRDE